MNYCKAVISLLMVFVVGLLVTWNIGSTRIKQHLKFPAMTAMAMFGNKFLTAPTPNSPNVTATRILYGDGSCGDNTNRARLAKLLMWWVTLANKHKIKYTLLCGSLLGAYRNFDIIPWDHDVDVLIDYRDILKLGQLAEPRNFDPGDGKVHMTVIPTSQHNVSMDDRKRYTCCGKETPTHVDQCSIQEPLIRLYHYWTFLDIFNYVDNGGEFLIFKNMNNQDTLRRTDIFPLKPCSFMGVLCTCVNNTKAILEKLYGTGFEKPTKKCRDKTWVPA